MKLDNTILCIIKKIKKSQRADINRIFDEVTKTTDFQHITMGALSGRVNEILQSKKIMSKVKCFKESFFLNGYTINM